MRSESELDRVLALVRMGLTDREIANRTGVPRSTVGRWRRRPRRRRSVAADPTWRPTDRSAYAYLLGLYLGDGHIVVRGASASFRLSLDDRYPGVVDEAITAIRCVLPKGGRFRVFTR